MRPTVSELSKASATWFNYDEDAVRLHAKWEVRLKQLSCEIVYRDRVYIDKPTPQYHENMGIGRLINIGVSQYWTAYIKLPNEIADSINYPKDRDDYMKYDVDLNVPCGITYSKQDGENVVIGWDYQHLCNKQAGKKEDYDSIVDDIESVIARIEELSPQFKAFVRSWEG